MSKRLKVGIIGAGRIGRIHSENLSLHIPNAEAVIISDVRVESARAAAGEFSIPRASQDHHEILDRKDVDAVVICSPTNTHARMIEESSARGKHIFCEKPIDMDLNITRKAVQAADKARVKLMIGFNRRFDANFQRVAESVTEGKIGAPHIVRITSRDPTPPSIDYLKASGGIFIDMTIHDFDMARFLVNEEIEEVYATGGNLIDPEIGKLGDIDTAVVTMRYKSGAICVIDNSRKAVYGYDQRVEVFGSKGCLTVSNNTPDNASLWDKTGQKQAPPLFFFLERYKDAYISEMKEFVNCVLEDRSPSVTGNDGLKAIILGLTARKSFKEKRPVRVEE